MPKRNMTIFFFFETAKSSWNQNSKKRIDILTPILNIFPFILPAVSTKMTEKERDVVVPLMMRGFKDCALEANSTVTGGQTVMNPWCTIGGVATTVCQPNEFIM